MINYQNHLTSNRNIEGFAFFHVPHGKKVKDLCIKVLTDMINKSK